MHTLTAAAGVQQGCGGRAQWWTQRMDCALWRPRTSCPVAELHSHVHSKICQVQSQDLCMSEPETPYSCAWGQGKASLRRLACCSVHIWLGPSPTLLKTGTLHLHTCHLQPPNLRLHFVQQSSNFHPSHHCRELEMRQSCSITIWLTDMYRSNVSVPVLSQRPWPWQGSL